MTAAAPSVTDYLAACNAAYCESSSAEATSAIPSQSVLISDASHALSSMGDAAWKVVSVAYTPGDGFYGLSMLNKTGDLIVAYEGTSPAASTYGIATLAADAQILAQHTPTALVHDAISFASSAELAAKSVSGFNGNAYVTGHSLGGIEAEYVSIQLNTASNNASGISFDGGVTFGATGIPGYSNHASSAPKMVDYVDYGDPVGNYASNMPSGAGKDFITIPFDTSVQDHVGTVVMEGSQSNWNLTSTTFLSFGYHMLDNYEADLGVSIPDMNTVAAPGLATEFWDYLFS